ncbi:MAG: glycosyltransferase [Candidatus Marinimicrobia bacterium]|nr:glycosyltransferase [Candidatus Neomarinimicrobiota bacterium]
MNAILFLGDFFRDARCTNMADSIIDDGQDLVIIHSGSGSETYRGKTLYNIDLPSSGINKYWKFYQQSKEILKGLSTTCIIAGDLYSLPSAASIHPPKLIYDSREIYSQLAGLVDSPIKQLFWSFIEKINIQKASMVVVTADSDSEVLKSIYGDIPCITLKNLPSKKNLPTPPIDLYSKLNIPKTSPIFLYQGVLHQGRGIELVLPLLETFQDAHYVVLGDGAYKNDFENLLRRYDVQHRVHCLGSIPYSELLNHTASATIGFSLIEPLSQSYEHALPNKIFEYAAAGIPVITTDLPEMKNAITEFDLGHSVEFGNEMELIKAVERILSNSDDNRYEPNPQLLWEAQAGDFLEIIDCYA